MIYFVVGQGCRGHGFRWGGDFNPAVWSELPPSDQAPPDPPLAYPQLRPPEQPFGVQARPTPTPALQPALPRSPPSSSAGRRCAQQQPGYPRNRTGARHPSSASNEDNTNLRFSWDGCDKMPTVLQGIAFDGVCANNDDAKNKTTSDIIIYTVGAC